MLVKFIISIKSERIDKSIKRNPQVFTTESSIQSIHSRWNRCCSLELFGWLQQWMNEFILFNILKQQILMNIKLAFPWVDLLDFCISIQDTRSLAIHVDETSWFRFSISIQIQKKFMIQNALVRVDVSGGILNSSILIKILLFLVFLFFA